MTITTDDVRALVDGELSGDAARAVEAAIAADPELAREFAAQQQLRQMLGRHFDSVAAEPVPDNWTAMIAAAAAEPQAAAPEAGPEARTVIDFAKAREARQARRVLPGWGMGAAIAASLVLGVMLGRGTGGTPDFTQQDGALVASGALAKGLETKLAAADGTAGGLRVLATFRANDGNFCRVFDARAVAGIACRDQGGTWRIERSQRSSGAAQGDYRQAGSADADLLAAAQDMASGDPLDAGAEQAARDAHWPGKGR